MPDVIACSVDFPITCLGFVIAILGSLAAALCNVCKDKLIPGQITPPIYAPSYINQCRKW